MKKTVIAIALAMMSIFLVGCYQPLEPDRGVAQKIIGQWITAETDSKVLPTNEKIVYDFVSTSKAYVSLSFTDNDTVDEGVLWNDMMEVNVEIYGNDVTLTHNPEPGKIVTDELHVEAITNTTMIAKRHITIRKDGGLVKSEEKVVRYEKLNADYGKAICGLWEGRMISDQSEYDDGQEHRWEFKDDGTFVFYLKNNKGIWEKKEDEYAQYFVAGNLLCTRWKNAGEGTQENREWWEITAMSGGSMIWTALREKADGTQYTAAFSMHKVNVPTQAEIEKAIVGKWITALTDGEDIPTNEKIVFDIVSPTEAYVSLSIQDRLNEDTPWTDREAVSILIDGNNVDLSHGAKPGMVITVDLEVEAITDEALTAKRTVTIRQDGGLVKSDENMVLYEKMDVDYRKAICGLWEGHLISDQSEYDDGKEHRWEYKEDGTFVYYDKNSAGAWVPGDDSMNEYFVAGNLLCTRWMENGVENREWWEITAMSSTGMVWTSLREKEDGTRYTAAFSMSRVAVPSENEIRTALKSSKWMTEKINGEIALTNQRAVFTFISRTQAAITTSIDDKDVAETGWVCQREYDYDVEGNRIILTCQLDEHTTLVDEMAVSAIDDTGIQGLFTHAKYVDGKLVPYPAVVLELRKQDKTAVRYQSYILGTWEGRVTSDRSQYDDGQLHRWQFNGDSYIYYVKEGDSWVPSSDSVNEYFVDGRLLLTRWIENGVEYREWWEILSIDEHTMIWGALRRDEYGDIYPASFSMTKVN